MITLTIGKSWVAGVWLLSGPRFLLGTKPRNDLAVYRPVALEKSGATVGPREGGQHAPNGKGRQAEPVYSSRLTWPVRPHLSLGTISEGAQIVAPFTGSRVSQGEKGAR